MWHKQKQGIRNVFYPAQKNASLLDVQGKDKKIKRVYYFLHLKFTYIFSSFEVLFSHFIPIYTNEEKKQIVNYFTFKMKFNKVTYESVLIKVIVKAK